MAAAVQGGFLSVEVLVQGILDNNVYLVDDGAAVMVVDPCRDALQIMEACLAASALPRNEYGDFYTECTALLAADALAYPADAGYYIAVYEYMQQQRDKLLENNGSVFALSSQLAAFCGTIYRRT